MGFFSLFVFNIQIMLSVTMTANEEEITHMTLFIFIGLRDWLLS